MRDEDKQQYLDMIPRVFVRALRDPHGNEEYELSEGTATDLLRRREDFKGGALFDALHLARNAIAAADEGAFGYGETGYSKTPYPIKDELLTTIDAALEGSAYNQGNESV